MDPADPGPPDPGASTAGPQAEELTPDRCWQLLRDAPVGRLVFINGDRPEVFPVNHLVDHASIVFRTAAGTKLLGTDGRPVAFEADGRDSLTGQVWSVVAQGRAHQIQRMEEIFDTLDLPVYPWHRGPKPRFVRVQVDEVTGRRFTPVR
jgi:uncharacterized protein